MSNKLLSHLEDRLKDRRRHLLKEVNMRLSQFNKSRVCWMTDTADIASNIIEDNTIMSLTQSKALEVNQIDNALKRMEKGKYGVCECCGDNISKQRLMVIPFASLCIKCKEVEERDQGIMINRVDSHEFDEFDEFEEVEKRNL